MSLFGASLFAKPALAAPSARVAAALLQEQSAIKIKSDASARGTDANLQAAANVEAFIDALPEWGRVYPKRVSEKLTGSSASPSKLFEGGKEFSVSKTLYSITTTPEAIVTFQPVNGFWLGGVIQERGILEGIGSFTEVPIEASKRPRMKITTDLLIDENVMTVDHPSSSVVQQAISTLINKAVKAGAKTGSSISYKMTDNHSLEQTALELGLDARYMGGSVKSSLESSKSASRRSVSAIFTEKAFTVKADFEGRSGASAFFNDQFSIDDARKLVTRGQVSVNNMPAYLASITYGRMIIFTVTAEASESEITSALAASYEAVSTKGSLDVKAKSLLNSGSTQITVTSVGGPTDATSALIKSGRMADFFNASAPLNTMVPISYTVNTVKGDRTAAMARTTEYVATTYTANQTVFKYKVTAFFRITNSDDGFADNTVECYGELRLNGEKLWEISRGLADSTKRETGMTIDILGTNGKSIELTSDRMNPTSFRITGFLNDADSSSSDDSLWEFKEKEEATTTLLDSIWSAVLRRRALITPESQAGQTTVTLPGGGADLIYRVERM